MRFFSGTRDKKVKGKLSASDLFKQKQKAKPGPEMTQDEKYKQMLEARVAKLTEDAMMGRKKSFRLPGTKGGDDKPKELSKNAKEMMELLAQRKAQKDRKVQKKKEDKWQREQKAVRTAKTAAQFVADAAIDRAKKEAEEALKLKEQAQTPQKSYFFGYSDDNKDS